MCRRWGIVREKDTAWTERRLAILVCSRQASGSIVITTFCEVAFRDIELFRYLVLITTTANNSDSISFS